MELMVRGPMHHRHAKWIDRLIMTIADELEIPIEDLGETTWQREQADRGIEADLSYFFEPAKIETVRDAELRESNKVEDYPNPDLVVEVDISPPQVDRDGIYAALKVPEVWVFDGTGSHDLEARRPTASMLQAESSGWLGIRAEQAVEVADARGQVVTGKHGPGVWRSGSEEVWHHETIHPTSPRWQTAIRRRTFLRSSAYGLGGIALAGLLDPSLFSGDGPRRPTRPGPAIAGEACSIRPTCPIKAKRVIHLCMAGGPSQFESLDYKPEAEGAARQAVPRVVHQGAAARPAPEHGAQGARAVCEFHRHGQSGQEISDLFPHIAGIADEICIVRSMHDRADQPRPRARLHEHAARSSRGGRAWARGCSTAWAPRPTTCPASSCSPRPGQTGQQPVSARQWSAGFLPSKFQGIQFQSRGDAVHYIGNPPGIGRSTQRQSRRGDQPAQRRCSPRTGSTPRSRPGSPSTSWRSGCRPRCPS